MKRWTNELEDFFSKKYKKNKTETVKLLDSEIKKLQKIYNCENVFLSLDKSANGELTITLSVGVIEPHNELF